MLAAGPASAQNLPQAGSSDIERIVAVVNDQVISEYDLNLRMSLIVAATGGVSSQEEYQTLRKNVLDSMVDERLQIQEAKQFEIEATDAEINNAITTIARNNNMSRDDFTRYLTSIGSDIRTLRPQIESGIVWQHLIQGRFGAQTQVSEAEVDAVLNRLMESAGEAEYLVSEIFLKVPSIADRDSQRQLAQRLSEQLRNGAPFESLARQFSSATSAAIGGNMGWVMADQVNKAMATELTGMQVGDVSDPIETSDGFYVIRLQDRRKVLGADPLDVQLTLKQITMPFSQDSTEEERTALANRVQTVTANYDICANTAAAAADLGSTSQGDVGTVRLRDLPQNIRTELQELQVGQASKPFAAQNQMQVLIVCGRDEPEVQPPSYQMIENNLVDQRLAMMSRRYLRDLRQDAIIDYR